MRLSLARALETGYKLIQMKKSGLIPRLQCINQP